MSPRGSWLAALLLAVAAAAGCRDSSRGAPFPAPGGLLASPVSATSVLIVTSEGTPLSIALLGLDPATGLLTLDDDSPRDIGAPIGDVETLAFDPARRRIFMGSDQAGRIAVVTVTAQGRLDPVPGSPFLAERARPSSLTLSADATVLWVGYELEFVISAYAVDPASGAITPIAGSPFPTGAGPNVGTHVEHIMRSGDLLFAACRDTSNICLLRIDAATGALAPTGTAVTTNVRPDYLREIGDRLYCSLSGDGSVDAFDVDRAAPTLTRLAGAPYKFPGIGIYEHIEVHPGGALIAVGSELPAAVALYAVNPADGTLAPTGAALVLHPGQGGPEGMEWSPDGRFLYVASHVNEPGVYAFELAGGALQPASPARYVLPGRQIDLLLAPLPISR